MWTSPEFQHGRRSSLLLGTSVILLSILPVGRAAGAPCPSAITGPDTSLANASVEYALWHPIYQTFRAADEQLEAVTVWRTAADGSTFGILLTVVATDGTGTPLPATVLQSANGPDPSPAGDGIHPTPIRIVFSPPVPLSTGTRYALAFHQIQCVNSGANYDLQAISGPAADPALTVWRDNGREVDCGLGFEQPALMAGVEIIDRLEFCGSSPVPTLPTSWGSLKSHYR